MSEQAEVKKDSFQEYIKKTMAQAQALDALSLSLTKIDFGIIGGEHGTAEALKHLGDIAALSMETQMVMIRYDKIQKGAARMNGGRLMMSQDRTFVEMKRAYNKKLDLLRQIYQTIKGKLDEYTSST